TLSLRSGGCKQYHVFRSNGTPSKRFSPRKESPMTSFDDRRLQRRQFLATAAGLLTGAMGARFARADDLPENTNPRAIFGDWVEPDWDQRVTITVGPKEADLVGTTDRLIQAAVD